MLISEILYSPLRLLLNALEMMIWRYYGIKILPYHWSFVTPGGSTGNRRNSLANINTVFWRFVVAYINNWTKSELLVTESCNLAGALRWRHNGRDSVSNHQPHDCFLNCLFRRRSKKTSKLRVTGLCARNSPGTGKFPAQMASNAENVSIWWRHHELAITNHSKAVWIPVNAYFMHIVEWQKDFLMHFA